VVGNRYVFDGDRLISLAVFESFAPDLRYFRRDDGCQFFIRQTDRRLRWEKMFVLLAGLATYYFLQNSDERQKPGGFFRRAKLRLPVGILEK
jgi:hypothetical protein